MDFVALPIPRLWPLPLPLPLPLLQLQLLLLLLLLPIQPRSHSSADIIIIIAVIIAYSYSYSYSYSYFYADSCDKYIFPGSGSVLQLLLPAAGAIDGLGQQKAAVFLKCPPSTSILPSVDASASFPISVSIPLLRLVLGL